MKSTEKSAYKIFFFIFMDSNNEVMSTFQFMSFFTFRFKHS